jgi:tRNA 5-methylaminomethyl-2-thiouridine biosynthesis bifunctional protein
MALRSKHFDDVYFSVDDGLAETRHVFLDGNDLPKAWKDKNAYHIAETGFGTGLNFLSVWKLFEETTDSNARLHFTSVEKYPLSPIEIREALSRWGEQFEHRLDRLLSLYPIRVAGPHRIYITDRVTLTLWFGDIETTLPQWTGHVDAWFLDGFSPAKNPEMWTDSLYATMARLSHTQTTYATFTAAGFVRKGLESSGFSVEKVRGFGRKRDMIKGQFSCGKARPPSAPVKSIAIIGAGLAGTALAWRLNREGFHITLYEASDSIASAASGGKLGMVNPKLTAQPTPHSEYYTSAYAHALRTLSDFDGIDFDQHGSLHLCTDEDKDRRFKGYIKNLGWHEDHIRRQGDDLFYPDAASVSPYKLCHKLADNIDIRFKSAITDIKDLEEDIIILANGYNAKKLISDDLPIHSVRGQVSWVKPQDHIDHNICFGGYMTPLTPDGFHILGSSFQPWETNTALNDEDHRDNIKRYNKATANALSQNDIIGGWAGLRTSSKDRFPIVGHYKDNVYISTAHGSHGIISSLMAAEIIAAHLSGDMVPASPQVLKALSPKRFHRY